MDDTILGGLPGDLISGSVGGDTLFGDYDDEVTVEQVALLNDSVAHLGMDDWPAELPPDTETIIYGGKLWRIAYVGAEEMDAQGKPRRFVEIAEV